MAAVWSTYAVCSLLTDTHRRYKLSCVRVAWHLFPGVEVQFAADFEVCVCVTPNKVNKWFFADIQSRETTDYLYTAESAQIAPLDWLQKTNCIKYERRHSLGQQTHPTPYMYTSTQEKVRFRSERIPFRRLDHLATEVN